MKRIQACWHDEGQGGISLVMTIHDEGQGSVYQVNATDGTLLARNRTEQDAKSRAAEVLKDKGHVCSPRCTTWIEIT